MTDDQTLYLAIELKSGELVKRDSRPLYATQTDWESLAKALPTALIPTTVWGLPFAALPLLDKGEAPDVVGRLFSTLDMLTKVTEMATQRIEAFDRRLAASDPAAEEA